MSFLFKQFSVSDEHSSMKVGTDAVLLGAWARKKSDGDILEIGTGSGLIALMMAQRFPEARILGIDIHPPSVAEAKSNFKSSPWKERLTAKEMSLQEFSRSHKNKYGMIISNPPFFNDSLLPQKSIKKIAHHTFALSHAELASAAAQLLHPKGNLSIILDVEGHESFSRHALEMGLCLIRQMIITPVLGKAANRILSEWGFQDSKAEEKRLNIRDQSGAYTPEYIDLTKAFYLAY